MGLDDRKTHQTQQTFITYKNSFNSIAVIQAFSSGFNQHFHLYFLIPFPTLSPNHIR